MHKFLPVLTLAAIIGCRSQPDPPPGEGRLPPAGAAIVMIGPPIGDPHWPAIVGGARRFLSNYPGVRLEVWNLAAADPAEFRKLVQSAKRRQPAAVILYVTNMPNFVAEARGLASAGPRIVTIGLRLDLDVFGHVEVGLADAAGVLGQNLANIAPGRRTYVLLHANGGSPLASQMYLRFNSAALEQSGIVRLTERNVVDARASERELVAAMLAQFPSSALVVTLEPSLWLSRPPEELLGRQRRFATIGAPPTLWGELRSGRAAALVGALDGEIGAQAAELALEAVLDIRREVRTASVRCELVTPETLDDFARRYAESAGLNVAALLPDRQTTRPSQPN